MRRHNLTGKLVPESSADMTHPDYLSQVEQERQQRREQREKKHTGYRLNDKTGVSSEAEVKARWFAPYAESDEDKKARQRKDMAEWLKALRQEAGLES